MKGGRIGPSRRSSPATDPDHPLESPSDVVDARRNDIAGHQRGCLTISTSIRWPSFKGVGRRRSGG